MFDNLKIFEIAQSLAQHASLRQGVVARNITHSDTPGYQARDIRSFSETYEAVPDLALRDTRSTHLASANASIRTHSFTIQGGTSDPNGNTVSLEDEMVKSAFIRQQHDMALAVYRSGMNVLRSSLGR